MADAGIAIVGCGYWGQKLIRVFTELGHVQLRSVCDFDLTALAKIKRRHPKVQLVSAYDDILSDTHIDAVVIATPLSTHFPLARRALLACKHVLVEKPMTATGSEALELVELSIMQHKTLMVDHTFVYSPAVRQIKAMIDSGDVGDLLYYDSVRASLGLVQSDTNVLWDLGTHDLSILSYLCDKDPLSVSAIGARHCGSAFENVCHVSAQFDNNLISTFHLNWLSAIKMRRVSIGGSKQLLVYDDMEVSDKLKIYENPIVVHHATADRERSLNSYQNGGMRAPNLDTSEPLRRMAIDFLRAIDGHHEPVCDGHAGYRVVRLLELAQRSIAQAGLPVELHSAGVLCTRTNPQPAPAEAQKCLN